MHPDTLPLLTASRLGRAHLAIGGVTWSPDSSRFLFTARADRDGGRTGDLMQMDATSGKARVLLTRAQLDALKPAPAAPEADELYAAYASAQEMQWAPDGQHLLFDEDGALWWVELPSGHARHLVDTGGAPGDDPKIVPDGRSVSFLRNHNIVTASVTDGSETAVTHSDGPAVLNGEVDWVYEEELETTSNYAWSPDASRIAYLQMDEAKVPQYPLVDYIPAHVTTQLQRYPQAGDPNPAVRVGVVAAHGGPTRWIDLPISANNDYIPRFGWMDGRTLWIEVLRRSHKKREFFLADATTGEARAVASDEDPKYLNDNYDAVFLNDGRFLFSSWRDGHTHLYLYRAERTGVGLPAAATLQREVESGDYEVEDFHVAGYRPAGPKADSAPRIYYTSNEGEAIGHRLWSVGLDGSGKRDLTPAGGTHSTELSPDGAHFLDTSSAYTRPPSVALCQTGASCRELDRYKAPAGFQPLKQTPITATTADGTSLYGTLSLPFGTARGSIPLILYPYGGPGVAETADAWSNGGFDRVLAAHGFAVLHADNRGMGGRGRTFEQVCYHAFGPVELTDQLTMLDATLKQYPQLDAKRLGWFGYSWGGTFTLYALTHSDRFLAGVEGSGVTDWRDYDSIYTERYLGLPDEDKQGYMDSSVVNNAGTLHGRLLISHGTSDDNVHIQNTMQMIQALIAAGKPYDLELSPRASHRHHEAQSTERSLEDTLAHFETYVKNAAPAVIQAAPAQGVQERAPEAGSR